VVADDDAVLDICLGIDGALASVAKGAVLANVSRSTRKPRATGRRRPGRRGAGHPVLGGPTAVEQGAPDSLIGGPTETVRRLDPLWADLAQTYVYCGSAGAGATMKLMSNLQLIVGVAAAAEAIATARADGLADDLIATVFAGSPVVSPAAGNALTRCWTPKHPGWFSPERPARTSGWRSAWPSGTASRYGWAGRGKPVDDRDKRRPASGRLRRGDRGTQPVKITRPDQRDAKVRTAHSS